MTNSGDPDDTRRLRRTIRDPRVRWFDQPPGLGMLDNLLAGLAQARGEYVAILHDDDRWSPRFLPSSCLRSSAIPRSCWRSAITI